MLFIGNSLTYTNDLPATFKRIAAADGRRVITEIIAEPNYSLEDHLNAGVAKKALQQQWDFVVLQQGPSSMDDSRQQLIHDVKAFAALTSSRIAVLMVWPPRERWGALVRVAESHRLAAEGVQGVLIPAGTAMDDALRRKVDVFQADGFHPSPAGTRVVALAIYRALFGAPASSPAERAPSRRRF
ncbi:MAG: SGNH/GDSL hydrolase family protein [Thermoanaerobaculia bacterium]